MYFEQWWQGIVFGIATTVALLVIAKPLNNMWKKYQDIEEKTSSHGCDAHH